MKTEEEKELDRVDAAAAIAKRIVADIESEIEEADLKILLEISGRNIREFEARMRAIKFLENKKREQNERDDARFFYVILVYLCGVDPLVAAAFCAVSPAPAFC